MHAKSGYVQGLLRIASGKVKAQISRMKQASCNEPALRRRSMSITIASTQGGSRERPFRRLRAPFSLWPRTAIPAAR